MCLFCFKKSCYQHSTCLFNVSNDLYCHIGMPYDTHYDRRFRNCSIVSLKLRLFIKKNIDQKNRDG